MGWSVSKSIRHNIGTYNPYDPNQYHDANATWFQRSWWGYYHWAWVYTNDTPQPLKLTKASFNACAGHSNGKYYDGGAGSPTLITKGYGCTFTSDLYVIDASGKAVGCTKGKGSCDIPSIGPYNCYYGGYGNVCTNKQKTSFGHKSYFGPGTAGYKYNGENGYRRPRTINYSDCPIIPPGGKLFVHIYPTAWKSTDGNCLLVMDKESSSFTSEFEPENKDYIWVVNGNHVWEKKKKAFMRTNTGWKEMKA